MISIKIVIDKKSQENILIYDISYRTLIDPKPLRIRFDQIDGFIKIYDGSRYLTLIDSESLKSDISDTFSHHFSPKIKAGSCDSLPIEKYCIML